VARGRLHRLHRGVYAVGLPVGANGRRWAAILAAGDGAVLSHRAAADHTGLRPSSRHEIEVTVPRPGWRADGIHIHGSRTLDPDEVTTHEGMPCTSVPRTLLDLADVLPRRGVERAIERAEMLRVFDLHELHTVLARANGRRGVPVLRSILAAGAEPALTRDDLEEALFAICAAAKLPRPQVNLWIPLGAGGYEADFAWPEQRVIAEADGREAHGTRQAFEHDRRRDRELLLAGWRVVRFTWREIQHEPETVARTLLALLT
jgi:very-short-patch-repair endonuclease